jgi:hypothetical protein
MRARLWAVAVTVTFVLMGLVAPEPALADGPTGVSQIDGVIGCC